MKPPRILESGEDVEMMLSQTLAKKLMQRAEDMHHRYNERLKEIDLTVNNSSHKDQKTTTMIQQIFPPITVPAGTPTEKKKGTRLQGEMAVGYSLQDTFVSVVNIVTFMGLAYFEVDENGSSTDEVYYLSSTSLLSCIEADDYISEKESAKLGSLIQRIDNSPELAKALEEGDLLTALTL